MKIIFATHNEHKVKEVNQIINIPSISLRSLREIGWTEEINETGSTLQENAWIKADTIYNKLKSNVIAEDTGLEVFAIDMAPGVYSARYAGTHKSDDHNIDKLLSTLEGKENRKAQFRTVLAMWLEDQKYEFEGIVTGQIGHKRQGSGGFGYDPIFIPDGYSDSFGVLDPSIKNQISHRAKAVSALQSFLLTKIAT